MFDTIGERITYCRSLLGMTRNDLAEKLGGVVSLPTIARWELNTVIPSLKKIDILVSFFISQGISVSTDWVKNGEGYPPISIDLKKFDSSQFDELAYSTLVSIRNIVKDFFFQQVNSNFFRPVTSFGDYVGGIIESNKKLIDKKLCFVSSENHVTAGIYNYEMDGISNISGEVYQLNGQDVKIGEVQWIIRRP